MRKRRDDGPSSSWRRPGNPRWPARRVLCLRQRPLATRCDLLERYKWSHNVGRWEEGVASTNAAPPQRGPKLRASTVSGLGDGPGRAAGLVLDATWQVLTQVPLGGGVLASGLHALFMGTSPTPTFTSASSSGRSAVRSSRPQPPPSPPGLTVTPTHSSHPWSHIAYSRLQHHFQLFGFLQQGRFRSPDLGRYPRGSGARTVVARPPSEWEHAEGASRRRVGPGEGASPKAMVPVG